MSTTSKDISVRCQGIEVGDETVEVLISELQRFREGASKGGKIDIDMFLCFSKRDPCRIFLPEKWLEVSITSGDKEIGPIVIPKSMRACGQCRIIVKRDRGWFGEVFFPELRESLAEAIASAVVMHIGAEAFIRQQNGEIVKPEINSCIRLQETFSLEKRTFSFFFVPIIQEAKLFLQDRGVVVSNLY